MSEPVLHVPEQDIHRLAFALVMDCDRWSGPKTVLIEQLRDRIKGMCLLQARLQLAFSADQVQPRGTMNMKIYSVSVIDIHQKMSHLLVRGHDAAHALGKVIGHKLDAEDISMNLSSSLKQYELTTGVSNHSVILLPGQGE